MANLEALVEANRRGILPDNKRPAFDEAVRRGIVPSPDITQSKPEMLTEKEIPNGINIRKSNDAWVSNLVSPDMIKDWESRGKIGMVEAYQRLDKWEMLPVLNGKTAIDSIAVVKSFNSLRNGAVLSNKEMANIREFVLDMAEIQTRKYSIGGRIVDGALRMPAYIGEMALAVGVTGLTLGAAGAPSLAAMAQKQAIKTAAKVGAKKFASRAVGAAKKAALVSAVGGNIVMLPRVAKKAFNDHLSDSIAVTDKGKIFIKEAERAPAEYALRAAASVFVENFAELAGGEILSPVVGAAGRQVGKALPDKFVKGFKELLKKTDSTVLKKAGFTGILEEIGEERLTDLLITSFDLDENRGYSTEEFLSAMFPDVEDFFVEAGIITIAGSSSRAAVGLVNQMRNRGVPEKKIKAALSGLSELQVEEAVKSFKALEGEQTIEDRVESTQSILEKLEDVDTSEMNRKEVKFVEKQIAEKSAELDALDSVVERRLEEMTGITPVETAGAPVKKRISFLSQKMKTLDKEIESLALQINSNIESGKSTVSLEKRIEAKIEERNPVSAEIENLSDEGLVRILSPDFQDKRIITKQGEVDAVILKEKKKSILQFRAAFKDGVRSALKDAKTAQKILEKIINVTALSDKNKKKFINEIIQNNTPDKLRKNAPKIQRRIERLLDAEALAKQKDVLKDLLSTKALKAVIVSGKKTGKFNADIQARLESLSEILSISGKKVKGGVEDGTSQASRELERRLKSEDVQDTLANKILNIKANPSDVTASEVAEVVAEVKAIKIFGVTMAENRKAGRREDAQSVRDDIIDHIQDRDPKAFTRKKSLKRDVKQFSRSALSRLGGSWNELIDRVAPKTMSGVLGVRKEISKKKRIIRQMEEKLVLSAHDAFKTDGDSKKLAAELDKGNKVVPLGLFDRMKGDTRDRGRKRRLEFSRSQARKLWMEVQTEGLLEGTVQNINGNAYTNKMLESIFSILDTEAGDYRFAESQLQIYGEFYDQINEVYSRVFGINLSKVDFYSPLIRAADKDLSAADVFLRDASRRRAIATGSAIHMREAGANSALVHKTDLQAFSMHISEMANFIAFREKTMLLDAVFGNKDLREQIEHTFGQELNAEISDTLEFISGIQKAEIHVISKSVNYINRNFATSVLGLKAKIGLTQLASYPMLAETVPVKDFLRLSGDFFLNMKEAVEILGNTELMLGRGSSVEVDISKMGQVVDNKMMKKIRDGRMNLIDYTLVFTKFGDRAAIYVGGWAVYKHALESGKTHEEAIAEFEARVSDTQQSKDPDQVSYFQRANSVTRGLSMFMSAPIAQFRGEVRVIRRFQKGESNVQELAKGLIIYHVLVPQIFQALSNGIIVGAVDGEDQLRTLVLGSLAGVPIMGDVVNAGFRAIQGKHSDPKEALKQTEVFVDAVLHSFDLLIAGKDGDYEDAMDAIIGLAKDAAKFEGLPVAGAELIVEGVQDIADGDRIEGGLKVAGFPKSVTNQ